MQSLDEVLAVAVPEDGRFLPLGAGLRRGLLYDIGISYVINFYCPLGPPPILEIGLRHLSHLNIGGFFIPSSSLLLTLFSPA